MNLSQESELESDVKKGLHLLNQITCALSPRSVFSEGEEGIKTIQISAMKKVLKNIGVFT